MESDRPDSGRGDFAVRLAWPAAEPPPAAAPTAPGPSVPTPPGASSGPSAPATPTASRADAPPPRPTATVRPPVTEVVRPPRPATTLEVLNPNADNTRMGRVFVEAFDRLADRLLERLRSLRQDVDADLAAVRSELSSLRQAIDDMGDRVQMRQLRLGLDELRSDVTGLRRAVLEWPELEQVANDIASMRSDLNYLFETSPGGGPGQSPNELLSELRAVVAQLGERAADPELDQPQLAVLGPLVEEVASVRSELTSIRRRMVLRASPLDEEQLEQIVSAVAARVVDELAADGRRSKRR